MNETRPKDSNNLKFLDAESRRKRLLKLQSLLTIVDNESVQVARTSDLELVLLTVLLNTSGASVLSTSDFEEILDVQNLLGH